jgi:glycosyltransferase involved in cell wall biosynthesis
MPVRLSDCIREVDRAVCVRSVLDQDVDFHDEVVVREDCSKDSTASILAGLESENGNRLKVMYRQPNIGTQPNLKRTLAAERQNMNI